jgi:MFS family permease
VEIWGAKAGPFLQQLNFVSVTGFTIAPLLVKPFLHEVPIQDDSLCANDVISQNNIGSDSIHLLNSTGNSLAAYNTTSVVDESSYIIYITYLLVGIYGLVIAFIFVIIIAVDKKRNAYKKNIKLNGNDAEVAMPENKPNHGFSQAQLYTMYFLYFWMILFYGGIEVAFPGQVTRFVNKHLCWPKSTGASLASVVMGCNATFTFIGILLSVIIPPLILIWIDVLCLCGSIVLLCLFIESYPWMIWLCSALVGISSATIMPSAYTLANDLFQITWLFNSAFWCGFFSGFMISNLTGYLMITLGNMWFCYTLLICSVLVIFFFLALTLCTLKNQEGKILLGHKHTEDLAICINSCKKCINKANK